MNSLPKNHKSSAKPTRNLKLEGTPELGSSWDKKQKERQRLKLAREKELEMKADIAAKRQVRSLDRSLIARAVVAASAC